MPLNCQSLKAQFSLKDKSLTVQDCIEHFSLYEATDLYHRTSKTNHAHVNQVLSACYNCEHKHERGQCRAYGHSCRKCGKANHFKGVCMTKRCLHLVVIPQRKITVEGDLQIKTSQVLIKLTRKKFIKLMKNQVNPKMKRCTMSTVL